MVYHPPIGPRMWRRSTFRRHKCSARHGSSYVLLNFVFMLFASISMSQAVPGASSSSTSAWSPSLLPGSANVCKAPELQSWPVQEPRVPRLPSGKKPNFIVILADDMGHDDIGLHHLRGPDGVTSAGAQTPNIDKFIKNGMSFTNFYSAPLCAMGRAQLLTGRDYPRTGNLFNGLGYDAFSLTEATMGNVLQEAGYVTAHFGKWHNGRALGYEAWERGFNESWNPTDYVHLDNLMRHNGKYVQTKGLMEHALMERLLAFLSEREQDGKPFLIYYAPYSIHALPPGLRTKESSLYFAPEPYLSKIKALMPPQPTQGYTAQLSWQATAQKYAFLWYFDDVLGRLFDYIDNSSYIRNTTYTMLTSDNGASAPLFSTDEDRAFRSPSGMIGDKNYYSSYTGSSGTEGSLRTHLAITGPGIPSGAVTDTLSGLADILPTIAELAGATETQHLPWSGISFANLLQPDGKSTDQQDNRVLFTLVLSGNKQECPHMFDLMRKQLPDLGPDRAVLKPQPMLAYEVDGQPVMKQCIVGRYKDWKWFGNTGRVFRFANGSYIERPCNELPDAGRARAAAHFTRAAQSWWESVLAEDNSFNKPVFQLGLKSWQASNVEAAGAVQISRGNMTVQMTVNYTAAGDFICNRVHVHKTGWYSVVAMHISSVARVSLNVQISVGTYDAIQAGTAPSLLLSLNGGNVRNAGVSTNFIGKLLLESSGSERTEVCTKLLNITDERSGYVPVVDASKRFRLNLANLRFTRVNASTPIQWPQTARTAFPAVPAGMPDDLTGYSISTPAVYEHLKLTPEMSELEKRIRGIETAAAAANWPNVALSSSKAGQKTFMWRQLQSRYKWPDKQGVFESLYMPCDTKGLLDCVETCG